jgi:hypothetical protein
MNSWLIEELREELGKKCEEEKRRNRILFSNLQAPPGHTAKRRGKADDATALSETSWHQPISRTN